MADGPADDDPAMQAYLARLDLQNLDLSDVQLEPAAEPATTLLQWLQLLLLLGAVGWVLWYPTTVDYQRQALGRWWVASVALLALALAASLWRWAWERLPQGGRWLLRLAAAATTATTLPPLAAARRWRLIGGGLGLLGLAAMLLPREADWQDRGYGPAWLLAVLAAVAAGIGLGRWLARRAHEGPEMAAAPLALPPWAKWVTLATLLGGALLALGGESWFGHGSPTVGFSLGGLGFAVGLGLAIWLARRFDEMEHRARQEAEAARDAAIMAALAEAAPPDER